MHQEQLEQEIFKKFAPRHPGNLELSTLKSLQPPYPDIEIKSKEGEIITFELSEIVDQGLACSIGSGAFNGGFINEDPSFSRVQDKFAKTYPSNHPIELLLYYDTYPVHLARFELSNVEKNICDNIGKTKFRTVWIYAYHEDEVLLKISQK